jgi:hypothetical protein
MVTELLRGPIFIKPLVKTFDFREKKVGNQIFLTETDKNQRVTVIFNLNVFNNHLIGNWYQLNKMDTLQVELYKTNPIFKNTSKLPKLKDLLSEDIEFYSSGFDGNPVEQAVYYSILFARSNLLSVQLNWENYSYTSHYGTVYQTYNLSNHEIVDLKDDITDSCHLYLSKALQEVVSCQYENYTKTEWIEGMRPYIEGFDSFSDSSMLFNLTAEEKIKELFTVNSLPQKAVLFLNKEGFTCYIEDYCEQYYSAGNRAMTFDCYLTSLLINLSHLLKKSRFYKVCFIKTSSFSMKAIEQPTELICG